MVRLGRVVPQGCAEVVAKLEYLTPGGSVKDRAALSMIRDAERRGVLSPGATLSKQARETRVLVSRWCVPSVATDVSSSSRKPCRMRSAQCCSRSAPRW